MKDWQDLELIYQNDMVERTMSRLPYRIEGNTRIYIPSDRDKIVWGYEEIKVRGCDIILCNKDGEFWLDNGRTIYLGPWTQKK